MLCVFPCSVPESLANVSCTVRSYFPGSVNAGYYTCATESKNECLLRMCCISPPLSFQTGILTTAGELSFNFMHSEDGALPFAKALQMTECRRATPIRYAAIDSSAVNYTDEDKALMPLMSGETLLDKVEGYPQPVPFCGYDSTFGFLCLNLAKAAQCIDPEARFLCSLEAMGRNWFPTCPSCCTCGFYPFRLKKDMLVTEYSLITYVRKSRECACGSCCQTSKDYGVVWISNEMLIGHTLTINATGSEDFSSRCWKPTICGRVCCPIGTSAYNLVVQMDKNMTFNIEHRDVNAQWLGDAGLLKNLKVLDHVQSANYERDVVALPASPTGSPRKENMAR